MAFCSNCGGKLNDEAKFCPECGGSGTIVSEDSTKRKQEYAGKIIKCPSCGEELPSFTAICPACGHEINSAKVSSTLNLFIEQISRFEEQIANSQTSYKTGWASWNKTQRICWIVLNFFLFCIPLVIYLIVPLILINASPKLSKEEKQLASLIENFPFPNDRESILEALIFAKEKIDFISSERIDRKSAYWVRLWCSKAEQLKQKSDILFATDPIVKQSYNEIRADQAKVKKTVVIKAVAGILILIAIVVFAGIRGGVIDTNDYSTTFVWPSNNLSDCLPEPDNTNGKISLETDTSFMFDLYKVTADNFENYVVACKERGFTVSVTKTETVFYASNLEGYSLNLFYNQSKKILSVNLNAAIGKTIQLENFCFLISDYWNEEGSKKEYRQYYAETGSKVAMLSIAYPYDNDKVSLDYLHTDNQNMIKAIEATYDNCEVIDYQNFESNYGVKGVLYNFSFEQSISNIKYKGTGKYFCFPSIEDNRWFFVVLTQTQKTDKDYKDDYMKILASIKKKIN